MSKKTRSMIYVIIIVIMIMAALVAVMFIMLKNDPKESKTEIISKSTLEKIIEVSDLSTFEAVYNGIAEIMNEEDSGSVDCYVSYDAKVRAGIDFQDVEITVDDEQKMVTVELPDIKITDIEVDITSLDYIFENDKANTATISEKAYKQCIKDVERESGKEDAIYELAKQNASNIVEALISPFMKQFDAEYQLQIK